MKEKCLPIITPAQWRAWLAANHAAKKEAWLTIHKKRSTQPGLRLAEAVEEALCYGWIDGLMRRLDDEAFALRFSPRRSGAVWSAANIQRANRLIAEGRMTEAGMAAIRAAKENGEWRNAILREDTTRLPEDVKKALAADPKARNAFMRLPPSHKKRYLWWITGAKRAETRRKRIRETIRQVLEKKPPG